MNEELQRWEEYERKRAEYLLNKKPERYLLLGAGMQGFFIADSIKEKYDYGNEKSGYVFIPDFTKEGFREDDRHYNLKDLVNELNYLDFQVNGELYDEHYHIICDKKRLHSQINGKLDMVLNHLVTNDSFKIEYQDIDFNSMSGEKIIIDVNVSKEGFEGINVDNNHPLLDNLLSNELFDKFFKVINNYESELESSDDSFDAAKVDALIELKTRLFESIHKDQDLKNQLNFM